MPLINHIYICFYILPACRIYIYPLAGLILHFNCFLSCLMMFFLLILMCLIEIIPACSCNDFLFREKLCYVEKWKLILKLQVFLFSFFFFGNHKKLLLLSCCVSLWKSINSNSHSGLYQGCQDKITGTFGCVHFKAVLVHQEASYFSFRHEQSLCTLWLAGSGSQSGGIKRWDVWNVSDRLENTIHRLNLNYKWPEVTVLSCTLYLV